MYLKKLILLLTLFQLFFIFPENDTKQKKVCIIYYESKFKKEVVEGIEKNLKELNFEYSKDLLKNINHYDPADFDAVIILSGIAAFIPYPQATIYIQKHKYKKNIIYYCAAYTEDAIYGFMNSSKLDAITSASKPENIESTVNEIITRLLDIFQNKN